MNGRKGAIVDKLETTFNDISVENRRGILTFNEGSFLPEPSLKMP